MSETDKNYRVFISHSNAESDRTLLDTIQNALREGGLVPITAEHAIEPLAQLGEKVREIIESCDFFLAVLTVAGHGSAWVQQELGFAYKHAQRDKAIAILVEEGVELGGFYTGLEYFLFDKSNFNRKVNAVVSYFSNVVNDSTENRNDKVRSDKQNRQRSRAPTSELLRYFARGALYAITSWCALLAGYVAQRRGFDLFDAPYLALPIIASIYFFLCYASRFHSLEFRDNTEQATHALLENLAIGFFPFIAALLFIITGLVLKLLQLLFGSPISVELLISFGIYAAMYAYYGRFLLRHASPGEIPIVRHRLFWPVILSIGIGLYFGLSFSNLRTSFLPLCPLLLIVIMYAVSRATKLPTRLFPIVTSALFVTITTVVVLGQIGWLHMPEWVITYLSLMLFCLTVSAYLSAFESWKITSDIAKTEQPTPMSRTGLSLPMSRSTRYSIATLATLTGSVCAMPLFFVFSDYGSYFLVGFVIHAFSAMLLWYLRGFGPKLISYRWGIIKVVAAILFLLLVVLATIFPSRPNEFPIIRWLVSGDGFSVLALAVSPMFGRLLFDLRRQRKRDKQAAGRRILLRRINLVRILSLLSLIACFVLLTLLPRYEPGSSEYYKTELAFNAYALCIFLCLVVEILVFLKMIPGMTVLSRFLMGFVYLSRCVTSCLIGLCVFLPSLYRGLGVKASFLYALPFVLAAIGGFGLNDYFDADKDAINKPYRAIPSKKLTKKTVLWVGLANLTLASLCAAYVADTWLQAVLYGITILGVSCYNLFVRYLSLSKTVLTSSVSGLPILFSVTTLGYSRSYLFLAVGAAFFVLGREWLMDIGDMEGDLKGQIVTVPMLLGTRRTALFGFLFQFLSVLFMLPIALSVNSVALYTLLFFILLAVICLRSLWQSGRKEYQRRVVQLLWVPMLLGVLMLVW